MAQTERIARDYLGRPTPMPKPPHLTLLESYPGNIELWGTRGGSRFAVVYGLQLRSGLTRTEAAWELGECLLHRLQSEGRIV